MKVAISLGLVLLAALVAAPVVAGEPASRAKRVEATNFEFTPKTVTVAKGDRVSWASTEGSHTVTFKRGLDEAISAGGAPASKKFRKTGTFRYVCSFHLSSAGMKGKVVVK